MTKRGSRSSVFIGHTKNKSYKIGRYKVRKKSIIKVDYKINYISNKEVRNMNRNQLIILISELALQYEKLNLKKIRKIPSEDIFSITNTDKANASTSKLVNFFLQAQAKIKIMEYLDFETK
jgi:hypothetical protein